MDNQDAVSQAIVYLFEREMFYAEIIASMKRVNSKNVPVAGVCIKEYIELHINLPIFAQYSLIERAAILKHECEHILRNHIFRSRELAPDVYAHTKDGVQNIINASKHKTINLAADCAVNSNIKGLPEGTIYPPLFDLKVGETLEWYLAQLKDNEKANELTEFDGHELWNESEGSKEVLKEKIKQAINKAASKTRSAGRMTAEQELAISGFNTPSVNWRDQMKRFVARSIETTIESSKKKRNRRYGIMYPGAVKIEDLHIGVAIDTSGSMSNEALEQAMAEIGEISKYAKVTVVEADTDIKNEYVYSRNKKYTVKGRGGTAYQPALTHFKNSGIDALIYIGDMDNYDNEKLIKPKFPVLWAIVGHQDPPADWGSKLRITVK